MLVLVAALAIPGGKPGRTPWLMPIVMSELGHVR